MLKLNEIRAELVRKGVSIKDLSIIIKRSYSNTANKLRGKTSFTVDEIGIIAKYLDVDIKLFYN